MPNTNGNPMRPELFSNSAGAFRQDEEQELFLEAQRRAQEWDADRQAALAAAQDSGPFWSRLKGLTEGTMAPSPELCPPPPSMPQHVQFASMPSSLLLKVRSSQPANPRPARSLMYETWYQQSAESIYF